ncbi:MAG: hypothetical protein EXS10_07175 [Phycisphaerales bacterium]|nr:hypothetical protein [Phycisphaerales bacterium]
MADATPNPMGFSLLESSELPLQLRLDLLDVALGIRPAARVLVRIDGEDAIGATLALALGLRVIVGRGAVRVARSTSSYVDGFSNADASNTERFAIFYVALTDAIAEVTRSADESRDDECCGNALGYPPCCIAFVKRNECVPTMNECINLYSKGGYFNPLIWPGAAILDGSLLPHFPCSRACVPSIRLATTRWNAVRKFLPQARESVRNAARAIYWIDSGGGLRASIHAPTEMKDGALARASEPLPESEFS